MEGTLVDSSVILDILGDDPQWYPWSEEQLARARWKGYLYLNPIIWTEISIGFQRIEELEEALGKLDMRLIVVPREALFLAGKAFVKYKMRSGTKSVPLPDFFIGAHAAIESLPLLTRDPGRIRTYFPTVKLITVESAR
jgi:predicted nucleic acid-binding protein